MAESLLPQKVNPQDIIGSLQTVIDHNATLLIVDVSSDPETGVVTFTTSGGQVLTLDLSGVFLKRNEDTGGGGSTLPGSEEKAGLLAIANPADTKAMQRTDVAIAPGYLREALDAYFADKFATAEMNLRTDYDLGTHIVTAWVRVPEPPEFRLEEAGNASTGWIAGTPGPDHTYSVQFPAVYQTCVIRVRRIGSEGMGHSASVLVDTTDISTLLLAAQM